MKIYLIRHGQTEWNVAQRWQGTTDIALDEIGVIQAEKVAKKMTQYQLQAIYSSPLQRAAATAQAINQNFNLPITYIKDLEEIRLGEWEGWTTSEVLEKHADKFNTWETNHEAQIGLGVETNYELQQRAWTAFDAIAQKEVGDTLIVTHGAWIHRLMCKLLGVPLQQRMNIAYLANVGISIVNCEKEGDLRKYSVSTLNDASHLV